LTKLDYQLVPIGRSQHACNTILVGDVTAEAAVSHSLKFTHCRSFVARPGGSANFHGETD